MAKGAWRDAMSRLIGRSDVKESGVGRGNYATNHGGHDYNENRITERQQEVLDTVQEMGKANAARQLGISKAAINQTLKAIGECWGMENPTADDVLDADSSSSTSIEPEETYDDPNAPTVNNPWSGYFDSDGRWVE